MRQITEIAISISPSFHLSSAAEDGLHDPRPGGWGRGRHRGRHSLCQSYNYDGLDACRSFGPWGFMPASIYLSNNLYISLYSSLYLSICFSLALSISLKLRVSLYISLYRSLINQSLSDLCTSLSLYHSISL